MKRFAVVLAGCGVFDGAEIQEAVLTLLAIRKQGCEYETFAPDIGQFHVVNHLNGEETKEKRNVLVEASRIVRGNIKPLSEFRPHDFDILIFPGGFGVAKNLFTYAIDGLNGLVEPQVEKAVLGMVGQHKPIGALCIAPVLIARIIGQHVELTIGSDPGTAADIEKMGAVHKMTSHGQIIVDKQFKIVSSACYMLDSTIEQIWEGAENAVRALIELT